MGSLRSWIGSLLTLVVFFLVRRFTAGIAAPTFVAIFFACTYIWMYVLRIPEWKGIEPAEDELPKASATSAAAVATAADPSPAVATATGSAVSAEMEAVHGEAFNADTEWIEAEPAEAELAKETRPEVPVQPEEQIPFRAIHIPEASLDEAAHTDGASPLPPTNASEAETEGLDAASSSSKPSPAVAPRSSMADDSDVSDNEEDLKKKEEELDDEHADPEKAQELKQQGNEFFKAGKLHDAREAYSEALYVTPSADQKDKAVLFSNRAACFQKLSRWDDVVDDCRKAIELEPTYSKAYHRRAAAYEALSKWHDANEDLKKVIELDPTMRAKEYKRQKILEGRAQEQFDKDKDEMVGKLKDLGNMVLGKFGMSTDNFACEKDPDTGSYSIKFNQ